MSTTRFTQYGLFLLLLLIPAFAVFAQESRLSYGPAVTLEDAGKITAGAMGEAKKNNWNVAVAIVDNHGFLVHFERMDDTQTASALIAVEKARTAAMFRRPSASFENAVKDGRIAVLAMPGATPITGGLPVMAEGKVVGGIGVSGVTSQQDEQCARAGLEALKK